MRNIGCLDWLVSKLWCIASKSWSDICWTWTAQEKNWGPDIGFRDIVQKILARKVLRWTSGQKKYWLAGVMVGLRQVVVPAKLIMEIVWMSNPQPFVNLRLESSSTIIS